MNSESASAELEEDLRIRLEELRFLETICGELESEQQDRFRRSMLLMLYAHFEGFTKFALEVYRRHINEAKLTCSKVQPELATCSLHQIFKAFRSPDTAQNFLPPELRNVVELRPIAVERTFVAQASDIMEKLVEIPDKYIDLESNLKPIVLRKNLYRMGLPHDLFDSHEPVVGQLLGRRNNIAHGSVVTGIDQATYDEMRESVESVMGDLRLQIIGAIKNKRYLTPSEAG